MIGTYRSQLYRCTGGKTPGTHGTPSLRRIDKPKNCTGPYRYSYFKKGYRMTDDRIRIARPVDFDQITARALEAANYCYPAYRPMLRMIEDIQPLGYSNEKHGPTYRQAAYVAHRFGLTYEERCAWYQAIAGLGLTGRHVGHIIGNLDESEAMHEELAQLTKG